jgi:hypothetical protein
MLAGGRSVYGLFYRRSSAAIDDFLILAPGRKKAIWPQMNADKTKGAAVDSAQGASWKPHSCVAHPLAIGFWQKRNSAAWRRDRCIR